MSQNPGSLGSPKFDQSFECVACSVEGGFVAFEACAALAAAAFWLEFAKGPEGAWLKCELQPG